MPGLPVQKIASSRRGSRPRPRSARTRSRSRAAPGRSGRRRRASPRARSGGSRSGGSGTSLGPTPTRPPSAPSARASRAGSSCCGSRRTRSRTGPRRSPPCRGSRRPLRCPAPGLEVLARCQAVDSPWTPAPITTYRACAAGSPRRDLLVSSRSSIRRRASVTNERQMSSERSSSCHSSWSSHWTPRTNARDEGISIASIVPCGAHATASRPVPSPSPPDGGSCRPPRAPRGAARIDPGARRSGGRWGGRSSPASVAATSARHSSHLAPGWSAPPRGTPRGRRRGCRRAPRSGPGIHGTRRAPGHPPRSRAARTTGRSRRGTAALEVLRMRLPPVPPASMSRPPASTRPSIRSIRSTRSSSRS